MNNSYTIIIFGITGDLAHKKLLPDLFRLFAKQKLQNFIIIGAAIQDTTVDTILDEVASRLRDYDHEQWQQFKKHVVYQQTDINQYQDFIRLNEFAQECEKKMPGNHNRLVYCAVSTLFFCTITKHAADSGLLKKCEEHEVPWQRIVYEKPFGMNAASAQDINACIAHYFHETQIYRIDHYLTKEMISNIAMLRFTNAVVAPLWNNTYIDNIQIIMNESEDIGNRGVYYDAAGALSDVMQNHMLQMVSLLAMEAPEKLTGEQIRNERAQVLKNTTAIDVLLGQYEDYRKAEHIAPDSNTATFAIAMLNVNTPRWKGVPFYLKTGKCLAKKETVIHVQFKEVVCLLTTHCPSPANILTIETYPQARLSLTLNAKKADALYDVQPVSMEFSLTKHHVQYPGEYEIIFEEIMRGEKSLSVRFDEIEYAWTIIDRIKAMQQNVSLYKRGSNGPENVQQFEKRHAMRWLS